MRVVVIGGLIFVALAALGYYLFFLTPLNSQIASSQENELKIVVESNYPPYVYTSSDGKLNGYEIDLIHRVCKDLGKSCKIEAQDWSRLIISVQKGRYDVGIGGISITEKRKKQVDFSEPYIFPFARFFGNLRKHSGLKNIKTLNQIKNYYNANDFVIGVQSGTTLDDFLTKEFKSVKVLRYEANSRLAMDLSYGRVDAAFIETGVEVDFFSAVKDKKAYGFFGPKIDGSYHPSFADGIGMILNKGTKNLKKEIDKIIKKLQSSGLMKELSNKHFGYDLSSRKSK